MDTSMSRGCFGRSLGIRSHDEVENQAEVALLVIIGPCLNLLLLFDRRRQGRVKQQAQAANSDTSMPRTCTPSGTLWKQLAEMAGAVEARRTRSDRSGAGAEAERARFGADRLAGTFYQKT